MFENNQIFYTKKEGDCIKNITEFRLLILGIIFVILMSISGIYALVNQTTDAVLNTEIVDIKLKTYTISNNQEVEYGDQSKHVSKGEVVSLIPKVSNIGVDCYLRIKVDYINDTIDFKNYVTGLSNSFKQYVDYYYYDGILKHNDTLKIFDTIKIPDGEYGNILKLVVTAEAIQTKNFEPDYSSDKPWKDIKPEAASDNSYNIDINDKDSNIQIEFANGTESDFTVPNNFLKGVRSMLPGDTFVDSIEIHNADKKKVKYYMGLNIDGNDKKGRELLSKMNLKITNQDGKVIYLGKFLNYEKIFLGEYKLNDTDKLIFEVSLPAEVGNQLAHVDAKFKVIFSAEYKQNQKQKQKQKQDNDSIEDIINPKTGDPINLAITIFLISSVGLITVMILAYIEKRKEEC